MVPVLVLAMALACMYARHVGRREEGGVREDKVVRTYVPSYMQHSSGECCKQGWSTYVDSAYMMHACIK